MGVRRYRFGTFEFDAGALALSREGRPVRLQRQPAQVLAALLDRAGTIVTREELRRAVWGQDTFVDFERGLNFCIAQIRTALADDADAPRYIRTSPKKGYEFICPVRLLERSGDPPSEPPPAHQHEREAASPRIALFAAVAVALVAAAATYFALRASHRPAALTVAVARFDNETTDPGLSQFSDWLTDAVVEQLTVRAAGDFSVIGNAAVLRRPREQRDLRSLATSTGASFVVIGQIQGDAQHVRVLGHLIRLPDETHVTVSRFDDVRDRTVVGAGDLASRIAERFARLLARSNKPLSRRNFPPHFFLASGNVNLG